MKKISLIITALVISFFAISATKASSNRLKEVSEIKSESVSNVNLNHFSKGLYLEPNW